MLKKTAYKKSMLFPVFAALVLLLNACSGSEDAQQPSSATQQTEQQSAQQSAPSQTSQPTPQTSTSGPYGIPKNGKVIKAMHAGGYTYMQLEKDGKEFWIAATMMNVKRDDYVHWADAAVMKNFTSSTLHRTFDEILFVTNVEMDQ